jgi:formylglycine-generating enzyme required for sulfatase activity
VVQALAAHIDDPNWREVSLRAIGYIGLVQRNDEVASAVLSDLLVQAPGEPGQAVLLAGECVADVGATGVTPACRQTVMARLTQTLGDVKTVSAQRRAAAGRLLGQRNLGDLRAEVTSLEALQFCYVPPGPFCMGSAEEAEGAFADEKPQQEVDIPYAYWISRHPISNGQFAVFVAAGGYANSDYWPEAHAQGLWRPGEVREVWYTLNEKEDGLVRHEGGWRKGPVSFGEPYTLPNHPVVGVNWCEALAFARWFNDYLAEKGWLPSGGQVRLPNEPEWEKAARGGLYIPQQPLVCPGVHFKLGAGGGWG